MSWGKEQFKHAYSRAKSLRQTNKDLEDEQDSKWWCDYFERSYDYSDEYHPTMDELRIGKLLSILVKLRVRCAKDLLDQWYW